MGLSAYTAEQIRAAEQPLIEAGEPLMQRAAHGLAEQCTRILSEYGIAVDQARILILAGSGNNGADALYAGSELSIAGAEAHALLTGERHHPAARVSLEEAGGTVCQLDPTGSSEDLDLLGWDLIIDGVLGTGARGPVREPAAGVFHTLSRELESARSRRDPLPMVVACDVPSGVDPTTGRVYEPVLPVERTVTFGAASTGLLACPRPSRIGGIEVVSIGLEHRLSSPQLRRPNPGRMAAIWPPPQEGDHKYTRGVLGALVGSQEYPGAGLLCVRAAANTGAGMIRFIGDDRLTDLMAAVVPEAVRTPDPQAHRVQAWGIGSGATGESQRRQMHDILTSGLPVVADAAALPVVVAQVAASGPVNPRILMTPHAGELAECFDQLLRLDAQNAAHFEEAALSSGVEDEALPRNEEGSARAPEREEIEAAPWPWARLAHTLFGATVLVKGAVTVVAGPGTAFAHSGCSPWLATGGSGDVLAGILGTGFALRQARIESGQEPEDEQAWAEVAAAALLIQTEISTAVAGPVPPTVAVQRIPESLGRLLGE